MTDDNYKLNDVFEIDEKISYRELLLAEKRDLQNDITTIKSKSKTKLGLPIMYILTGIIFVLLTPIFNNFFHSSLELLYILPFISSFLIIAGLTVLVFSIVYKSPYLLMREERILIIDEELELLEISEEEYEKRAEIQFKNHQKEVKRYYDINLNHLKLVFPLGIAIIIVGIFIIIFSIILFKDIAYHNVMPTIIGAVSGLFVDFIGAIFIKMYIETIKASTEFHNQLIHSNNNLFANVLVTKITDENIKNETFSELAKIISTNKK